MVYVVLCPGAHKGSTDRGSGSKNISEDGNTAKRLIRQTGSRGMNSGPLGTRQVTYPLHHGSSLFCGCSLEVGWVYFFV